MRSREIWLHGFALDSLLRVHPRGYTAKGPQVLENEGVSRHRVGGAVRNLLKMLVVFFRLGPKKKQTAERTVVRVNSTIVGNPQNGGVKDSWLVAIV
jgi:hypothetical protein